MTLTVDDLDEFELIQLLLEALGSQPSSVGIESRVIVGAGDDCAAVTPAGSAVILHTTDTMVEGIHFLREMRPEDLGWKSLASNLSDIAAMGGLPTTALITLAIPPALPLEWLKGWYRGAAECAGLYRVSIAGGDIVRTKQDVCITVSLNGEVEPSALTLRSGANAGDLVMVTGTPGDSSAGLAFILAGRTPPSRLRDAHLRPRPRIEEARAAVKTGAVRAMIDVSDGPGGDIRHICEASHLGVVIHAEGLPLSAELRKAARELGRDPLEFALSGGEDYELLLCVAPGSADDVLAALARPGNTGGTVIGKMTETSDAILLASPDGTGPLPRSFTHFQGRADQDARRP